MRAGAGPRPGGDPGPVGPKQAGREVSFGIYFVVFFVFLGFLRVLHRFPTFWDNHHIEGLAIPRFRVWV